MNAQSTKIEVLWSPNKDEDFATYGSELKLYSFQKGSLHKTTPTGESQAPPTTDLALDEYSCGVHIGSLNSDITCMPAYQTVAWQHNDKRPYYFAVGQSSGKVVLTNLGLDQSSVEISPMNQVLSPRYGRPCICLAWNPSENTLLAEGLEKSRSEGSLIIWDTTRISIDNHTPSLGSRLNNLNPLRSFGGGSGEGYSTTSDSARHFEAGAGEMTSSLTWLPQQSSCLVAGMGTKYLRLYDIREHERYTSANHPREVVNHKAISGICVDPLSPNMLATYSEGGSVYIWDMRVFSRPAYTFTRNGNILRLSWMPTRYGCLSMVISEPPYLRLIDIPSYTYTQDQMDVSEMFVEHLGTRVADRCPYYNRDKGKDYTRLTGLHWHSKWENICLLATADGRTKKLDVFDKVPLSWSPHQHLLFSTSEVLLIKTVMVSSEEGDVDEDISIKMRRRIKEGYGFDADTNSKLLIDDNVLCEVWRWVKLNQDLTNKGILTLDKITKTIPGVARILGADQPLHDDTRYSISKRSSWNERLSSPPLELPPFPIFSSPERKTAFKLCGWSFNTEPDPDSSSQTSSQTLEDYLKREEMNDHYERSAAIAVFQRNIRRGIASLKDGAMAAHQKGDTTKGTQLNLIALALSGYTPQEKKLWHDTCAGVKAQITQPYLKAIFVFLCSTGRDGFSDVLNGCKMSLQDCVAFACSYLDDGQLHAYIMRLTTMVVEKGQIHGLFLTGLTTVGIKLLTNFVNQTGDVQTASLIAGQVMPFSAKHKEVQAWFQGYRDLLDIWQLWHERALFDGQRKKLDVSFKPPRQAYVMCGFCSKSVTCDSLRHDRRSHHGSSEQRTPTSCPNCRKPLPRCSLCLLNMIASGSKQGQIQDSVGSKVTTTDQQFGQWFTWCQSCRHGGHAHHIAEWFNCHKECPVTGCQCNCFSLDCTI